MSVSVKDSKVVDDNDASLLLGARQARELSNDEVAE
jgi:hypothetical protein